MHIYIKLILSCYFCISLSNCIFSNYGNDMIKFSDLENEIKKHQQEQESLTEKYQELVSSKLQLEKQNESLNR